ncbi:hypothetical protein [Pseudomonas sp. 5P_3.1_Bac2]|uniref:hypothetical protein n=1 Tax=Pseudomonas sp. 5P_3.1_Bac2 TaxID=2971617 RepID=UPI0021CA371E|nr:hypothetical protein [Pseudomonas sp. 5P_3.1_Bac2]MCU1717646.1 hypothetical protein [Pseudomonas sp. 5P_3.1_Bac2]
MNLLSALRDALYFFIHNLGAILRLCLPLIVLEALLMAQFDKLATDELSMLLKTLAGLLFYPLYSAALILFLAARSSGAQPRTRDLLAMSLTLWPRFALLTGLMSGAILLGASIFILPGIWLLIRLAFAEYLLVLERCAPIEALKRSFQLTGGHLAPLLGWMLLVMLPIWLIDLWGQSQALIVQSAFYSIALNCATQVLQLFSSVLLFRLFMQRQGLAQPARAD